VATHVLQDFLTSSYLITSKDTFYTREQFGQLMAYMGDGLDAVALPPPAIIAPQVRTKTNSFRALKSTCDGCPTSYYMLAPWTA
jgi:RNA polymerase Rpb1, domain 3